MANANTIGIASVEIWLEPGGDFVQLPNGDLKIALDTSTTADASRQRLQRLLLTNPRLIDGSGRVVSAPDDLCHPDWGAGLPALVDADVTPDLISQLQARILNAVLSFPGISSNPEPVVSVTQDALGDVFVSIRAQTISGGTLTIPSLPLNALGALAFPAT